MSKAVVEDWIGIKQSDDSFLNLQENAHHLYAASNHNHDFDISLNKSYDLKKYNEDVRASAGTKTILDTFAYNCTNWGTNTSSKLSETENLKPLESDESLGILPDLLNDELTFDVFKTGLCVSDEIYDTINPEIDESPASLEFSSPFDSQLNKINLFLKNISTPLPNFENDRRCSSTPKLLAASWSERSTENNSSHFLPDDKEPIIAGSCHIKFETDFNLDDLKNVKPLTSTNKALSLPPLSAILNELSKETDLISKVSLQERLENIENNLNVTQTDVEMLFPYECKKNIRNGIFSNTFQIKQSVSMESVDAIKSFENLVPISRKIIPARSNNSNKKEKVKTLDSTYAIPRDELSCKRDCEKTFVIDFNPTIGTEVLKSIYKEKILNETHVLEKESIESFSNQKGQIANLTFTKDLDDTQISFENHSYSFHSAVLKPVLEETFSKNDFYEMKGYDNSIVQCINSKSQSTSPKAFNIKRNVTFSGNSDGVFPDMTLTENSCLQVKVELRISPTEPGNSFHEHIKRNIFHEQTNPTENDFSNEISLSADTQLLEIPKENCSLGNLKSSYPNVDAFLEKADKVHCDINLNSIEKNEDQISQNPLKEMANATFSEKTSQVKIELNFPATKKNTDQTFIKEITDIPFSKLADKDSHFQHKIHLSHCDRDSVHETLSLNTTNFDFKSTDKHNFSLKDCSLESKIIRKSKLLKPSKIVYPKKVSEHPNSQLTVPKSLDKPIEDKRSITSKLNKRLSLFRLSASNENKSKRKTDLKKSFAITSKVAVKRPVSNLQKSGGDTKYSNEHLKNITTYNDKQSLITQPCLISDNSKVKSNSFAPLNHPVSSRLSLREKLPIKSLKTKAPGLSTTLTFTDERISNRIRHSPKIIDLPRKEKLYETQMNNADSRKKHSKHFIATILPPKFPPFNNLNNICSLKPPITEQKSAYASNSCNSDSEGPSSVKLPNCIAKPKFSSLSKVQSYTKTSSKGSESKNANNRFNASKNHKSNDLSKLHVFGHEAIQCVKSQISTGHVKLQTCTRKNAGLDSFMSPSSELAVQPLNRLDVKKSNRSSHFLPIPKFTKGGNVGSLNSKDVHSAQHSKTQNQDNQQTSGKLQQFQRIPIPRYNK